MDDFIYYGEQDTSFQHKLNSLWTGFQTSAERTMDDFIGMSHLTYILDELYREAEESRKRRALPKWLEDHKGPALIAATKNETFRMLLSIYSHDPESIKPRSSEVLICDADTNIKQIQMFIQRSTDDALSYHCMINCHLLTYKSCRFMAEELKRGEEVNEHMRIAFIYDPEFGSAESYVRHYLGGYNVKTPMRRGNEELKEYLRKILLPTDHTKSPSIIDPNGYHVRLVKSEKPGVGKSLWVKRHLEKLMDGKNQRRQRGRDIIIPLHQKIDVDAIIERLYDDLKSNLDDGSSNSIHFDIAQKVHSGVDAFILNMFILGSISDSHGKVWQVKTTDYYVIECMPVRNKDGSMINELLELLPNIMLLPPSETLEKYHQHAERIGVDRPDCGFDFVEVDEEILRSSKWQSLIEDIEKMRPKDQYFMKDERTAGYLQSEQLQLILENCGLENPTWSEVNHFINFLSDQLKFVKESELLAANEKFREIVLKFIFKMAQDFATRSLDISEAHQSFVKKQDRYKGFSDFYELKRSWEQSNHPYIFFTNGGESLTAIGLFMRESTVTPGFYDLYDATTNTVIPPKACISKGLKRRLNLDIPAEGSFGELSQEEYIVKLRSVMMKVAKVKAGQHIKDRDVVEVGATSKGQNGSPSVPPDLPIDASRVEPSTMNPDTGYVITMDNAKKMLAIHERLRADIPVIIMGETGCGKTKLVEFMSRLQIPKGLNGILCDRTMCTLKIHGGTTDTDILEAVKKAEQRAFENTKLCAQYTDQKHKRGMFEIPLIYTVLFLDEANTTEAICLIKEILCDRRMNGIPLDDTSGLKVIAACNPYRRYEENLFAELERNTLGYSGGKDKGADILYGIPMRELVYRVQPLPVALRALVWDFGSLVSEEDSLHPDKFSGPEYSYIQRMVQNFNDGDVKNNITGRLSFEQITDDIALLLVKSQNFMRGCKNNGDVKNSITGRLSFEQITDDIALLLVKSQNFMRACKSECSFVSLRDVQRFLDVAQWFYEQRSTLFAAMRGQIRSDSVTENDDLAHRSDDGKTSINQSIVLALSACYYVRLDKDNRETYLTEIGGLLHKLVGTYDVQGKDFLKQELKKCADCIMDAVCSHSKEDRIAHNAALKENIFMMIVCIQNKVPLFLIGKPGSSKSLAKSMVMNALQGKMSSSGLFKQMKRTQMVSYQCSAHSTSNGIQDVFRLAAKYQPRSNEKEDEFVSVVVLDEVGLAEGSHHMPLKVLHPLLEVGVDVDDDRTPVRCGFIGISNWALDPAKMNRGIFVQRGVPDYDDLLLIANMIYKDNTMLACELKGALIAGYNAICDFMLKSDKLRNEFYGLRDFYSLMKMISQFATTGLTVNELDYCIIRNFSGLPLEIVRAEDHFKPHIQKVATKMERNANNVPPCDNIKLIETSLTGEYTKGIETRYLLIIVKDTGARRILMEACKRIQMQPEVVFGSGFSGDLNFSQVCRDIHQIKLCMATGKPVILLNLDDLYESLYDTLNQYFFQLKDKRYIELGLGTSKSKAFVHDNFRLVVIADEGRVERFPIPLLSRLEKHHVTAKSLLTDTLVQYQQQLETWIHSFSQPYRHYRHKKGCCDSCCKEKVLNQSQRLLCTHVICRVCVEAVKHHESKKCSKCSTEITIDTLIQSELHERREYFDSSGMNDMMVGYGCDMIPSILLQLQELPSDKILDKAKMQLLQCMTADAVLRLDQSEMKETASQIIESYLNVQSHENLLQFFVSASFRETFNPSLTQITTYAPVMTEEDVNMLNNELMRVCDFKHRVTVTTLFLKNFSTREAFGTAIRDGIQSARKHKQKTVILVQCEHANDQTDLLDSARYTLESKCLLAVDEGCPDVHIVLLLSLVKGKTFKGFQSGEWCCVHIDNPRIPEHGFPSLKECMRQAPSELLEKHYCDRVRFDAGSLLRSRKCLPAAMSIIEDPRDDKLDTLSDLSNLLAEQAEFCQLVLDHCQELMHCEEQKKPPCQWVVKQATKSSNMNKSESLRHSVMTIFCDRLVRAMAAVISFVNMHENTKLVDSIITRPLFLSIFKKCHLYGLAFEQFTAGSKSEKKLPSTYVMEDRKRGTYEFGVKFPFSWIVKDNLESLLSHASEPDHDDSIIRKFNATPLGEAIEQHYQYNVNAVKKPLFEDYLSDFCHMEFQCENAHEHQIYTETLSREIKRRSTHLQSLHLVHVNQASNSLKSVTANIAQVFTQLRTMSLPVICMEEISASICADTSNTRVDLLLLETLLSSMRSETVTRKIEQSQLWIDTMDCCSNLVTQILSIIDDTEDEEKARNLRRRWKLLKIEQLYIEHVVLPCNTEAADRQNRDYSLAQMKQQITEETTVDTEMLYTKVKDGFLKMAISDGFLRLKLGCLTQICPGCKKSWRDWSLDPIKLECLHYMCARCISGKNRKMVCMAAKCQKIIPDGYFDQHQNCRPVQDDRNVADYRLFRERINNFFKHFITDVIFEYEYEPSSEMVNSLLSCVMDKGKAFNIFDSDTYMDQNLTVDFFLLGLLLKCLHVDTVIQCLSNMLSIGETWDLKLLILDSFRVLSVQLECDQTDKDYICKSLKDLAQLPTDQLAQLEWTSDTQNLLMECARILINHPSSDAVSHFRKPLEALLNCKHFDDQPRKFLMRQLLRTAGYSDMCDILGNRLAVDFSFVISQDASRFFPTVITEPSYLSITFFNGDVEEQRYKESVSQITCLFHNSHAGKATQQSLQSIVQLWGVKSEIALSSTYQAMIDTGNSNMNAHLSSRLVNKCGDKLSKLQKKLLNFLLDKSKHSHDMHMTARGRNLTMLVVNVVNSLCQINKGGFLFPLRSIINQPGSCKDAYIPAIPGDNQGYTKPNTAHLLLSTCSMEPRDLSPLSCAVLSCIVNVAVLAVIRLNPGKGKYILEKYSDDLQEAGRYLSSKIQQNLNQISESWGDNVENCLFLVHQVIHRMRTLPDLGENHNLVSTADRAKWEIQFDVKYVKPSFSNKQKRKVPDNNIKRDPNYEGLCKELAEKRSERGDLSSDHLWFYIPQLTVASALNYLSVNEEKFIALKALISDHDVLVLLQYLPDIINLNCAMSIKFSGKLSRKLTEKWTMRDFWKHLISDMAAKGNDHLKLRLEQMVDSFIKAWTLILVHPRCNFSDSGSISRDTLLKNFLNYKYAQAETSVVKLIRFLCEAHNRVIKKHQVSFRSEIGLAEISKSNLVIVENSDILLSIIRSHAEYDMSVDSESRVSYNWKAAERDVLIKYIMNKPLINFTAKNVPSFVYQEDFNLHNQICSLSPTQLRLSPELALAVSTELALTRIPDLEGYLNDIQVIINFMSTSAVKLDAVLQEQMQRVFSEGNSCHHRYLSESIKLYNIKHVWMLLKYAQADRLLKDQNQRPFDDIETHYSKRMPEELRKELKKFASFGGPKTKVLLHEMFEFITMTLSKEAISQDILDPNKPIHTLLVRYIEKNKHLETARNMHRLTDNYTVAHAEHIWMELWQICNRRDGM